MEPIPTRTEVTKNGFLSAVWLRFLNKIFSDIYKRLDSSDATLTDHETRITTLEP